MSFRKITVKSGNEEFTLEVTEEEYRNYFRPWWQQKKHEQRNREAMEQNGYTEESYEEWKENDMVQDAPAVVKVQQICGAGGMDLYLDERDRAEGLWRSLPVLSGILQLQFCIHFFCFCRQAFPQKHGLAVGKPKQVGEHPKPGAERVLLTDVAVDQQPDFF